MIYKITIFLRIFFNQKKSQNSVNFKEWKKFVNSNSQSMQTDTHIEVISPYHCYDCSRHTEMNFISYPVFCNMYPTVTGLIKIMIFLIKIKKIDFFLI